MSTTQATMQRMVDETATDLNHAIAMAYRDAVAAGMKYDYTTFRDELIRELFPARSITKKSGHVMRIAA
jgi:hypothetical protein